jgi:hypothetical protein
MKKLFSIGLLTVCALALSERQAQAWVNAKFSIGLNWHVQSGNNNVLWGLWKNGQVPGPEAFGGGGQFGPMQGPGGQFGPMQGPGPIPPAGVFPYFGGGQQGYPQRPTANEPPQSAPQQQAYYGMPQNYTYNPYQPVSYQPNSYYSPSYYYPPYNQYYGSQAPSYWYQGR